MPGAWCSAVINSDRQLRGFVEDIQSGFLVTTAIAVVAFTTLRKRKHEHGTGSRY